MLVGCLSNPVTFWGIVAHKINSILPDFSPYVHLWTHVNRTAHATRGCPDQLSVVGAHGTRAAIRTPGVALVRVRVSVVFHFIIPGLNMEGRRSISAPVNPQVLSNGSEQVLRSMVPLTLLCPVCGGALQLLIPHHVFHVRCSRVDATSQFVVELYDLFPVRPADGSSRPVARCVIDAATLMLCLLLIATQLGSELFRVR